jgi:hypothetical protein
LLNEWQSTCRFKKIKYNWIVIFRVLYQNIQYIGVYTSENVSDKVCCFFRLANITAETASLEFVGKGIAMKEMKNEGIFVVGTLKTGYPRIQALSQDKEHDVHPPAVMYIVSLDHTSL